MINNIINSIEQEQIKKNIPKFNVGDVIEVKLWVVESNKKRIQLFDGLVIAIRNRGLNSAFTLRKIASGEAVERVLQTHSPLINSILIKRRGSVRRAKLYYLRKCTGKSARIKELIHSKKKNKL